MESTIIGIVVFRLAVGAHPKWGHGGGRTVVRDILDDRVPRAAIDAICKCIQVPAVAWCGRVVKTLGAGRNIRRYQREIAHRWAAFPNFEAVFVAGFQIGNVDLGDTRQHRGLDPQPCKEIVHCPPFRFDFHAGFRVPHEATDVKLFSQIEDKRPKPYALHRATDLNTLSDSRAHIRPIGPRNAPKRLIMCLAVPGKILEATDLGITRIAKVEFGGAIRQVSLDFVPEAQPGDFVLVHVGFAISRIEEAEAKRTYDALREFLKEMPEDLPDEVSG